MQTEIVVAEFSGATPDFAPSGHTDTFPRDNLPPRHLWPELSFELDDYKYPHRLNCAAEFLDRNVEEGRGDSIALISPEETLTYADLLDRVNRICNVLVRDLGMVPGNRVMLRSANNNWMVATYLAVLKAGGVVVATMPLLRAKELGQMLEKARITHALCDVKLREEMEKAATEASHLRHLVYWGSGDLEARCEAASPDFTACDTAADDVCLISFTSGTTGRPKGTMHFHRDMLIICDGYARHVLRAEPSDRFIGSAPLAFTFGLGGLALFPFRIGATGIVLEKAGPDELLQAIEKYRATVCFTAPTAYRVMAQKADAFDLSSLRKCVSAGETLPKAIFDAWEKATGLRLMDGIGGTEMLHIYLAAPEETLRPGYTGLPVPGYQAKVVDDDGNEVPRSTAGWLAVRGPIGCRYLDDPRQTDYVRHGWNIPGDVYVQEEDGFFRYQGRGDDMIIAAGYNIAGPEVEGALLTHPAVRECGVVAAPDGKGGQIVKAYVSLKPEHLPSDALAKALQDHVKAEIAPFKSPRAIEFLEAMPRTESGKLQRFALRKMAAG
ncbi:AMP-binding protein [Pararoseomonas sp. SCSIO 73927]|uniref:AMP-binding protein n=1 Tax=Pararoseomonas sp. SCSIO 73927 TaxID=3114537 RepID=UPI0030CFACE7